jgi:hypothetical protein
VTFNGIRLICWMQTWFVYQAKGRSVCQPPLICHGPDWWHKLISRNWFSSFIGLRNVVCYLQTFNIVGSQYPVLILYLRIHFFF